MAAVLVTSEGQQRLSASMGLPTCQATECLPPPWWGPEPARSGLPWRSCWSWQCGHIGRAQVQVVINQLPSTNIFNAFLECIRWHETAVIVVITQTWRRHWKGGANWTAPLGPRKGSLSEEVRNAVCADLRKVTLASLPLCRGGVGDGLKDVVDIEWSFLPITKLWLANVL